MLSTDATSVAVVRWGTGPRLEQFAKLQPAPRVYGPNGGIGSGSGGLFAATARAQELGDLFEYKLKEPITILKNRSAMVPIVQASIDAEKISVWNDRAGLPRPQRALWLTNTSGLTLDGGSFSVIEEETFAGEGIFEPIRPSEKRLVSYATDLAVNASSRNSTEQQRVTQVRISKGVMLLSNEIREKKNVYLPERRPVAAQHSGGASGAGGIRTAQRSTAG